MPKYHRLAGPKVSRTVLGTLFIVVAGTVLSIGLFVLVTVAATLAGRPEGADGVPSFGELADLALVFLMIAALLPATLVAARAIQQRPAGTLASVTGRLRWRWLLTCLGVAAVAIVLLLGGGTALASATGVDAELDPADLVGWGPFLASMAVLLLVVPPQAAAEEFVTRGWLLQAVGSWCRRPWLPIAVQAVIFAALHGWGTPWGFADLLLFGVVAGWLTVRTGGLEAAIALHVANNLLGSVAAAAFGELGTDETAADMPWQFMVVDVVVLTAYAWVVLRLARRAGVAFESCIDPLDRVDFPTQSNIDAQLESELPLAGQRIDLPSR
ncbi:membrane protease YdiL (CAAX protease family) [Actinoplanes tereljensis]|uniref:CAAX amino protease n=1 Tax=Paractinoplanes tereljensis TaxID=571912 RepID=A0A919TTR3_9ACTN|nr:type II CAAX endopeptidase family protein [Actinoplanes tereljensis]GIF21544.1 CAAX amino protease [Actinoplanes tereljensis]